MKKTIVIALMLSAAFNAAAQGKKTEIKAGDFSIGVNVNPMTAFAQSKWQPKDGSFAGDFVDGIAKTPKQMYILAQDPVASFKLRYHMTESMALRAQFGLTGSVINYTEYVTDDQAVYLNPISENKVADVVTSRLNAASFSLALEFIKGAGPLKFNASLGLLYAVAGGAMDFSYGNPFNADWNGNAPTTMGRTTFGAEGSLNEGKDDAAGHFGIVYARPLKRFNAGYTNALGLNIDMGIEWFFAGNMSLGAAVTFTPIMLMFQPQTYTTYEAYTSYVIEGGTNNGSVIEYNKLVSPGSTGALYGTDSFGIRLSLNYYL